MDYPIERVAGIGGFFFRSADPEALAQWYLEHLGIDPTPTDEDKPVWRQSAGPTVFAPFPKDTEYFGSMDKGWMLNFRVLNLNVMVAQLAAKGIVVKSYPEDPNGRFARLHDPEGNPLELWEPAPGGAK